MLWFRGLERLPRDYHQSSCERLDYEWWNVFDDVFDECVDSCKENGAFGPNNHGMLSKCRFDGAEGTVERFLALRTMRRRMRDERSHFRGGRPRRRTSH